MMKTLTNENIICFDVDDTLIVYTKPKHQTEEDAIEIYDPRCEHKIKVWKHNSHIKFMKQQRSRGRLVIVWSHSGYKWAQTVIENLDLNAYVDYTMTKPSAVVDDATTIGGIVTSVLYLNRDRYLGEDNE